MVHARLSPRPQRRQGLAGVKGDPYLELADDFVRHYETLRGVVRHALVARQLREHMPEPPADIVDVGGGAGHQSIPLASEGYRVVILDQSAEMLRRAEEELARHTPEIRSRVRLVEGAGEHAPTVLGRQKFEVVLCHGVLMYLEEPGPMLAAMAGVARPGAILSVLAKNAAALALRPALRGRFDDAVASFDTDRDVGGLGVVTRGDTVESLAEILEGLSVDLVDWYGVRVLTDHRFDERPGPDLAAVLAAEWEASRRDPYRSVGRLIHVIGRMR